MEVKDQQGNRVNLPCRWTYNLADQRCLADPGEEVASIPGASIWSTPPIPGKYRFVWKADLSDRHKGVLLVRANYVVRRP